MGIKKAAAATGPLHVAGEGLAGKRASFSRARPAASRGRQPDASQGSVAPTVSIMPAAPKTTSSVQKRL